MLILNSDEREKNDPVLIGFHENLLLNNGNLLSTLDRLNGKELQIASFGWKPGCCVSSLLHSLSMWYLLPRKFTGPRATIKLRDGKQYQHQSSPYILFNFIFLFFFVEFILLLLFCLFPLFYEGSTLSIAQTVKNNVTRVSLYILTVIIVNVHAAQFTRSFAHWPFVVSYEKKPSTLCVLYTQ